MHLKTVEVEAEMQVRDREKARELLIPEETRVYQQGRQILQHMDKGEVVQAIRDPEFHTACQVGQHVRYLNLIILEMKKE